MRAVVTGGAGFLGQHVAAELASFGYRVVVMDLRPCPLQCDGVEFICGDVRDKALLADVLAGSSVVVHMAALVGSRELEQRPRQAIDVNICGALNVLEAARRHQVSRVVLPAKPNEPNNVYTMASQAVEKLGHTFRERFGLDVRVLRVYTAFGPGQPVGPVNRVVPSFVARALLGWPIEIHGTGSQHVDLVFAPDVARAAVPFATHPGIPKTTYECPIDCRASVLELAKRIVTHAGSKSNVITVRGEVAGMDIANVHRAPPLTDLLGGLALTPIEVALDMTLTYYRGLGKAALAADLRSQSEGD